MKATSVQVAGAAKGAVRVKARVETDTALVVAQAVEEAGAVAVTNPALALAATAFAPSVARKCLTLLASVALTRSAPIVGQR